ncbi:reverse transcriptase domain-containing protein [Tanacetum coccineum]
MYVDGGSSMEVLFEHCYNQLPARNPEPRWPQATTSLTVVSAGKTIWPIGQIKLLVTIRDAEHSTEAWMNFMIASDLTGVPRSIAEHKLNIRKGYTPVCQKKRGQAPERAKAIQAENAGATYQRLVDKAFDKQVGRNLEVYVDDLVIKSHTEEELLRDIEETFRTLRKINMKLNPKKCTFGAIEGMFLGYVV